MYDDPATYAGAEHAGKVNPVPPAAERAFLIPKSYRPFAAIEHEPMEEVPGKQSMCLPYACDASQSITPPNEGKALRIFTAILESVSMAWYPVPAAVLDAGAPR